MFTENNHFLTFPSTSKIAFPLGGIGTGSISLSGAGRLHDWEIFNRPNKNSVNGFTHFAVRAEQGGKVVDARILNGPFQGNKGGDFTGIPFQSYGFGARREYLTGMPHFRDNRFEGYFPFAKLTFSDPAFPGQVALTAFNPFIPMNAADSGLPAAFFEVEIVNDRDVAMDYTVVGVMQNPALVANFAAPLEDKGLTGFLMGSVGDSRQDLDYGRYAIATDSRETSVQRHWYRGNWFDNLEIYWKDLLVGGHFKDRVYEGKHPQQDHSLVASHFTLKPQEKHTVRYLIAWHVPNCRKYWVSNNGLLDKPHSVPDQWQNHYAVMWQDCQAVVAYAFAEWERLREDSLAFADAMHASTLPEPVLEAAVANLCLLKTPTVLRLEYGTFYGWEGCHPDAGSCEGTCDHVWNYQKALPFLFPALERTICAASFTYNQNPKTGGLAFRLQLPLGIGISDERPCADGQFGNVMRIYHDWLLNGDDAWLNRIWPAVKAAIEYAWHPDNPDRWDPDKSGVLWGRQHHTLDMELFGPSSWLCGMYLGALAAGVKMAEVVGDKPAAEEYEKIYRRGREWVNKNLFNGEYFFQQVDIHNRSILDPFAKGPGSRIVKGSIEDLYWSEEHGELKYQIDQGCIIDQVLGEMHASFCGLGPLFDRDKMDSAILAVYRHNFQRRLGDTANPCRVFGMEDESGVIICAWPEGKTKPAIPIPYSQESMHGFEYAYAVTLMQNGHIAKGVSIFHAVRERYNGENRNPWNEMECGSHYARSLASYNALPVLSGFASNMSQGAIGFRPLVRSGGVFRCFWSAGIAWGTVELTEGLLQFSVLLGSITLCRFGLPLGEKVPVNIARNGVRMATAESGAEGWLEIGDQILDRGDRLEFLAPQLSLSGLPDIADFQDLA